jgi:hypothetical protein
MRFVKAEAADLEHLWRRTRLANLEDHLIPWLAHQTRVALRAVPGGGQYGRRVKFTVTGQDSTRMSSLYRARNRSI